MVHHQMCISCSIQVFRLVPSPFLQLPHFIFQVTELCQQMKENMYTVYEDNSNEMQLKLQELTEVLESCNKLITELTEASQALAGLRTGLANSSMLEP